MSLVSSLNVSNDQNQWFCGGEERRRYEYEDQKEDGVTDEDESEETTGGGGRRVRNLETHGVPDQDSGDEKRKIWKKHSKQRSRFGNYDGKTTIE